MPNDRPQTTDPRDAEVARLHAALAQRDATIERLMVRVAELEAAIDTAKLEILAAGKALARMERRDGKRS